MIDDGATSWARRYLQVLGVTHDAPSLENLAALIRAHVQTVTFENITALRRRASRPEGEVASLDTEALLANWEARRGGGVCFDLAAMMGRLLRDLGYQAHPIQGQISFPGSHQAVLVELDGGRYLVDVGCGAPLFAPIPLDGVTEVRHAGLAYRFRPADEPDTWLQERLIDGAWSILCRYDLRPVDDEARDTAYQRHHLPGESWVTGPPRLIACTPDAIYAISNHELTVYTDNGKETRPITEADDYRGLAADIFGLPDLPIEEVLASR